MRKRGLDKGQILNNEEGDRRLSSEDFVVEIKIDSIDEQQR